MPVPHKAHRHGQCAVPCLQALVLSRLLARRGPTPGQAPATDKPCATVVLHGKQSSPQFLATVANRLEREWVLALD
jgi:hypothetical protein